MKSNTKANVYSPHEVGLEGYKQAKRANEHSQFGIELDIPGTGRMDKDEAVKNYIAPLLPWEICAVQAQTSHGKTMFINFWERQVARQLRAQRRDEVIIHVSLEESVEAMAFTEYGRILKVRPADFARGAYDDWTKMQWAMGQIDQIPIWRIADGASQPEDAPELHLSNIERAIHGLIKGYVTGHPIKPAVVIVDYLQALPIDPEIKTANKVEQRRLQVAADVFRLRSMTTHMGCPFIVGVQCKQELAGANPPYQIPGKYDGIETSAIATRFDRILSLWLPRASDGYLVGETVWNKEHTKSLTVGANQSFLKAVKQRGGLPAGMVWEMNIDFQTQEYTDVFYREQAKV